MRFPRIVAGLVLTGTMLPVLCPALDKPTGAPLVMSDVETEQPIPLAYLSPDGKTAACTDIRLHWSPSAALNSQDDTASFALDIATDSPGAATFTAQLWSASLAGSLAWQKPWQGAHWKIFETPATDGTGIDAALAVGMIATSARRPYPKDTLVIGNLRPDSSLGAVSRLADRLDAAAKAGITRVIIPRIEKFETDEAGSPINIVRHAEELNLKCIPVDNIVEATEVVMNDPLPDPPTGSPPKYSAEVAAYIDGFAQHEQTEAKSGLLYAPKEDELAQYPARQAAVWKQVYAEVKQGNEAYKAGQVYLAWRLLARANSRMRGMNALAGQELASFDVKAALATSDELQQQLHSLMATPDIDHAELESGMLIAEMADWAYDIQALLEGSELVTKQTFSQRSDATAAERDRAREAILTANEEAKYLLDGADFYTGLAAHLGEPNPLPANSNAANLLPQLIPAQLATARIFIEGIRPQADELRVGLLFDPRLAAYVNVLREEKSAWDARERRRLNAAPAPPVDGTNVTANPAGSTNNATAATKAADTNGAPMVSTPANATNNTPVGFDPGNSYVPPHTVVESDSVSQKKLSDVAQCLIWVNTDCEIASLDEKYLRLTGTVDPATREWHVKDRPQLDTLLQLAARGAEQGSAFAQEAQVSPDIFAMILERASYLRLHGDDSNALAGLREYWRCALLGNMCWQLAHTHKAAAVDLSAEPGGDKKSDKGKKPGDKGKVVDKNKVKPAPSTPGATAASAGTNTAPASTNIVAVPATPAPSQTPPAEVAPAVAAATNAALSNSDHVTPVEPAPTNTIVDVPSVPPASGPVVLPPAPAAETNAAPATGTPPVTAQTNEPPIAPIASVAPGETNAIPVAPIAQVVDEGGEITPPVVTPVETNAAPAANAEHHYRRALPVDLSTNAPAPSDVSAATGEPAAPRAQIVTPAAPVPAASADTEYTGGDAGTTPAATTTNSPSAIQ